MGSGGKYAVLYKDKKGKRGWTIHTDEEAAHQEARIHVNRGDVVTAIVPVDESPDYPYFKLDGHSEHNHRTNQFVEIWRDTTNGKELRDSDTVGQIGGYELTYLGLQELHEYTKGALAFLDKANEDGPIESYEKET